jgi:hypothetical protein
MIPQARSVKSLLMTTRLLLKTPADLRPILETAAKLEHQWLVLLLNFVSRKAVRSRKVTLLLF